MQRITPLFFALAFLALSAAQADQYAYVATQEDQRVEVIDMDTGVVVDTWRTNGDPRDIVSSRLHNSVFLATENVATMHRIPVAGRIDFLLPNVGIMSHAVALDDSETTLYLLQSANTAGDGYLLEIDIFHPEIDTCRANNTKNCNLSSSVANSYNVSALDDPRYMVWSDASDTLFMVDAGGTVVEFDPASGTSTVMSLGSNPLPSDPRGMDASPDGEVVISSNGPAGPALTEIDPAAGNAVTTTLLPLNEAGGVAYDPARRRNGFQILVGDVASSEIVEVRNGTPGTPRFLGNGNAPVDLAINHRGVIVSANQYDTASVIGVASIQTANITPQPVAVAIGLYQEGPELAPDPYEVGWTYIRTGRSSGMRTVTLTSIGDVPVEVRSLHIDGYDRASFHVVSETCTTQPVDSGSSCQIELEFVPTATSGIRWRYHTYTANLQIVSDAPFLALPLVGEHLANSLIKQELKMVPLPGFRLNWAR